MAVADDMLDATIRHQIFLQRHKTSTVNRILKLLVDVEKRVLAELTHRDISDFNKARKTKLLNTVRKIIADGYKKPIAAITKEIESLAAYEAAYQTDMFRKVMPVMVDYTAPAAGQLVAAVTSRPFQGRLLKGWLNGLPTGAANRVIDEITMGFVEGRTTDQIIRTIRGTRAAKYADGILQTNRRGIEAMVRTSLNHTANIARNEVYKANSSVVKGVQWVSTLDGRTTAICRARDGKVWKPDNGPRPPAHVNCRSTTVPVLKSWRQMGINAKETTAGTRASINGQVAGDLTYNDWLKKQSKGFQDEVLGDRKAVLFRKGDLSMDRFVDRKGREFTLDELRVREPEAWKAAGFGGLKMPKAMT